MYGVPSNLPLQRLVGEQFNFVGLGRFQIQFHIDRLVGVSVEGRWELRDASGTLVDSNQSHADREAYRVHRIIDVRITNFRLDPPQSFTLFFETGDSLTIFDDSERYESFSINFFGEAGIYV
jgi:hypothetical protein